MNEAVVIAAQDATKHYGSAVALADLDLEVEEGSIFGFVGPSGSGKTTAVRLLTGSQRPTSGMVSVLGGRPVDFTPAQRARMGYMPQLPVLYPQLSVRQNLTFVASLYGLPFGGREQRMRRVLEFVELVEHQRKRLSEVSGGMQRRLALAAALVHDPQLLFLDEPTAGIDPVLRRKFWDHFDALRRLGRTLFVTTQYVGEAAYCDRVGVIVEGRMIAVDTPEGLRRRAFGGEILELVTQAPLSDAALSGLATVDGVTDVERVEADDAALRLIVADAGTAIPRLQAWLTGLGAELVEINEHTPAMDDVFVKLVEDARGEAGAAAPAGGGESTGEAGAAAPAGGGESTGERPPGEGGA